MRRALCKTGLIFLLIFIGHLVLMAAAVQAAACVDALAVSVPGHLRAPALFAERFSACPGEPSCPALGASVLRNPKIPASFPSPARHDLAAADVHLIASASPFVPGRSPDRLRALLQVYRV